MKHVTLTDFLTADEIRRAQQLRTAALICAEITGPNIERINKQLGQENDPMYLAYATEYVISKTQKENP